MTDINFPKYTEAKHKGNIGEAIAQYFLSKFSLVHKIDGSNDLGNDFICELIKDQAPTNLLFYVQVKFTKKEPSISESTKKYWKGSPIPVYIFWIKPTDHSLFNNPEDHLRDVKYKRMTPELHNPSKDKREKFKIYNEISFKGDLMVDYARTQYVKGFTPIIEPRDYLTMDDKNSASIGQYELYIKDVIPEYRNTILKRAWVQNFVIAELLIEDGEIQSYKKVILLLDLAQLMISDADREEFSRFNQRIIELKSIAQRKINEVDNSLSV